MFDRKSDSHKGDNGQIAVIGGSVHMHGAPILAALAAEAAGVDLVYLAVPACHAEVTKQASYNFQTYPFAGNSLSKKDIPDLLELLESMDCAVIGPGITEASTLLLDIIKNAACPLVLDAGALQAKTIETAKKKKAVLTPHAGELQRLGLTKDDVQTTANKTGLTFLVKGVTDQVSSPDHEPRLVEGGNPGLTVGGTGDVLAGLVGGLIAQGFAPEDACMVGSTIVKQAGDVLYESEGYTYRAADVIDHIPMMISSFE